MSRTGSHAPAVTATADASDGSPPLPFELQPAMDARIAAARGDKHPLASRPPAGGTCSTRDGAGARRPQSRTSEVGLADLLPQRLIVHQGVREQLQEVVGLLVEDRARPLLQPFVD